MRAGKKQAGESGKTRPCIVYVRNIREETASARLRNRSQREQRDLRELKQLKEQQQQLEKRARRSVGGGAGGATVQEKTSSAVALRHRQTVATPARKPASPSPTKPSKPKESSILAKRRNTTLLLGNPHQKLGTLSARRQTHTEPAPAPKMFKQAKQQHNAISPPPTIAASRSRRSIKPNPKYASEDLVTPKYLATLGGDSSAGSSPTVSGRHRQAKQLFMTHDDSDLLDLDEDNDDELADVAFNPQLHKSDEDDDDDDLSEGEFEQELRREKLPVVKRGRGRPPKVSAHSNASVSSTPSLASAATPKGGSIGSGTGAGRTAPSSLQQLRRTIAVNMARNNASLVEGSVSGAAKRKLEISESESPVARKRMVISSASGAHRGVPVVNGATKSSTSSTAPISRTKVVGGNPTRMLPQRSSNAFKVNSATTNSSSHTNTTSSTRSVGAASGIGAGNVKLQSDADDVPTFTIVNIDDIINQDDVLISRSTTHGATAAAGAGGAGGGGGNASKKLHVGRPRTRGILSSNSGLGEKRPAPSQITEKSNHAANSSQNSVNPAKRMKILASNSSVNTKPNSGHNQNQNQLPKPRPRILNTEMGKKTQPMKPLMSMGKELCPTDVDTEEDDPDPDLDLDDDEPTASIVTKKNPRVVTAGSGSGTGGAAISNKWTSNRRNVLSTTTASTVNTRTERKLTKLLSEGSSLGEEPVLFKKPGVSPQRRSKENLRERDELPSKDTTASNAHSEPADLLKTSSGSHASKYFPPETTTFCEEDGRVVKKITCYETWHVISTPKDTPPKATRQQRTCLELALVKLANVAARVKVPSGKWTSKVTLYKVSPSLMQRQTMTIFTGDLKTYNIPEEDRHRYQPSCVLFRRSVLDRSKCRVPYDRAIIFKNKCFYANIDGKHVNLLGAPESVSTVKDVEILLDIVDRLSLTSGLVEMVNTK
ncbi:hypothetical protein KR009_011250 [Drosophila setifemur]|nr:hypothetical protein KR009_011250 [Drosophila setifemur]